jgi:hypothetical protein
MTAEEAREATLSSANFKRKQDDVDEVLNNLYDQIHSAAMNGETKIATNFRKCYTNVNEYGGSTSGFKEIELRDIITQILKDEGYRIWGGQDNTFCVRWCVAFDEYVKG